jgi:protein required for attachment to host cells
MAFQPNENTGRLFDNKAERRSDKQPDYAGTAMINGVLMRVVAWRNPPTERNPKATLNMRFQIYDDYKREQAEYRHKKHPKTPGSAPVETEDFDDSIPF